MTLPFTKFHGFGNDYIVFERSAAKGAATLSKLAVSMCHRHTGVGSDGLAVLERLDGAVADYSCEIVNPDGSFASFSGNGTRCAVAHRLNERRRGGGPVGDDEDPGLGLC